MEAKNDKKVSASQGYQKTYGIIETLAPLHVGAAAGEEAGNLNLIFRDQFTQTGIIPGSSLRGRLRAEMRMISTKWENYWYGRGAGSKDSKDDKKKTDEQSANSGATAENAGSEDSSPTTSEADKKNGGQQQANDKKKNTLQYESRVKIEHASIVWLPVFSPGQPVVWVSCPRLLQRYKRIVGNKQEVPPVYTGSNSLNLETVFFNFGFVKLKGKRQDLSAWFPLDKMLNYSDGTPDSAKKLPAIVVADDDMSLIHDMALYRQSRVALAEDQKVVAGRGFFNVEALPEGTIMIFPIAIKPGTQNSLEENGEGNEEFNSQQWQPFEHGKKGDIYLGGLESVGFGHCYLTVK